MPRQAEPGRIARLQYTAGLTMKMFGLRVELLLSRR